MQQRWTTLSADSAAVTSPMLVLAGEHDYGVHKEVVAAVFPQLFPRARVEVLANSGHDPMDEIPVYLTTPIEQSCAPR